MHDTYLLTYLLYDVITQLVKKRNCSL